MGNTKAFDILKDSAELVPDEHDGSYELVRSLIREYSNINSIDSCTVEDLNAIYAMAIGTWTQNIEKKKDAIDKTHLSYEAKERIHAVLDKVWDNACYNRYSNSDNDAKGEASVGMVGTGFYVFSDTSNEKARDFIRACINVAHMESGEFEYVEKVFENGIKGMQAASASIILHCLKPDVFPIINGRDSNLQVYKDIGIELDKPNNLRTYISNSRLIQKCRDDNFSFKNYRMIDVVGNELYGKVKVEESFTEVEDMKNNPVHSLNTILYGPPGTGKTYNTVNYAVEICRPDLDINKMSRTEVFKVFNELKEQNRICFTTFHQSYGYEEFIEGIKPKMPEDEENQILTYEIVPGIFKKFCENASNPSAMEEADYGLNKNPTVWKVSLGHTYDNPIRKECLNNDHIRIGWDVYGEDLPETSDNYSGKAVLNSFYNKMRIGDIVLSCYSAYSIDAVGVISGEYEWHPEYESHKRLRKVHWLVKGINENIVDLNGGSNMTLSTIYKMKISPSVALDIVKKYVGDAKEANTADKDNYVFIIDEINRGNISKIFGELITLIEETKRVGSSEEMYVRLPYSNEIFGVPDNVYILGTMNTADRSIALMDTALRRRFSFVEMPAKPEILSEIGAQYVNEGAVTVDIEHILRAINQRIEVLYDREHAIGHAFFTVLKNDASRTRLAEIFRRSVIPLLQEYFYDDYSKIQLVLGDNAKSDDSYKFIRKKEDTKKDVFKGNPDIDMDENERFYINEEAFNHIESFLEIYE